MELKHSFKRVGIELVGLVALLSMTAAAQEIRSEISVQGTGFFTKNSQGNGVRNHAEETGWISSWLSLQH